MKVFKMIDNKSNQYLITADSLPDLTKYVDEEKARHGWVAGCIGQYVMDDDKPQLIGYTTMIKASCIRRIEETKKQTFIIDIKKAFDEEC